MEADPFGYEARYSLRGQPGVVIAGSLVFAALAALPGLSLWFRVADVAFFGGGGVLMLAVAASRRVALRVDADGITLGGRPPRYESGTRFVPWADIEGIVLWRQRVPHHASVRYFGLVRRSDAPPWLGQRAESATRMAARILTPGIPAEIVMASRGIVGWRLDEGRLAVAVHRYAPAVTISKLR